MPIMSSSSSSAAPGFASSKTSSESESSACPRGARDEPSASSEICEMEVACVGNSASLADVCFAFPLPAAAACAKERDMMYFLEGYANKAQRVVLEME